jgi:glycosyltransferase involved in cell wall biosynthesis
MGFGLPCIATTAGAAGEIIRDGQTGFLIPPEDPGALAACLGRLAADRELLVRMSLAARQRYREHPTWEQAAGVIRSFLQTFLTT